jgi:hypothetical protein
LVSEGLPAVASRLGVGTVATRLFIYFFLFGICAVSLFRETCLTPNGACKIREVKLFFVAAVGDKY